MSNQKVLAALPVAALFAVVTLTAPHAVAQQGMVAVRDQQTGKLRAPTPAEMQALTGQRRALAAPAQPTVVARPDSTRQVRLGERSQVYTIATRNADGQLVNQCVQGESAARAAVEKSAATVEERHGDR
jgi:hypothetical protein